MSRTIPMSFGELGDELGVHWRSKEALNTIDKLQKLANNAKSKDHARTLIKIYLKQVKRKLQEAGKQDD